MKGIRLFVAVCGVIAIVTPLSFAAAGADTSLCTISGVLQTSNGEPFPQSTINVKDASDPSISVLIYANGAGDYSFSVQPGDYLLDISNEAAGGTGPIPDEWQVLNVPLTVSASTNLDITIPVVTVDANVVDASATPVSGASISLPNLVNGSEVQNYLSVAAPLWSGGPSVQIYFDALGTDTIATTDSSGNASFELPPTSQVTFGATGNHGFPMQVTQDILSSPTSVQFSLPPTVTISGTLQTSHGEAIPYANLTFQWAPDPTLSAYTSSNSAGAYSISLPAGSYLAIISGGIYPPIRAGWSAVNVPISVSTSETLNLTIPVITINASVTDSNSQPVQGAKIELGITPNGFYQTAAAPLWPGGPSVPIRFETGGTLAETDGAGHASFDLFDATGVTFQASTSGELPAQVTQDVTGDPASVQIVFPATVVVSGTISTSHGEPIGGASIGMYEASNSFISAGVISAPNGAFSLRVIPGDYFLNLDSVSSAPSQVVPWDASRIPISISNATSLDLRLPVVTVNATVVDAIGNPVFGAGVGINGNVDNKSSPMPLWSGGPDVAVSFYPGAKVTTDARGHASFEVPPSAQVPLQASIANGIPLQVVQDVMTDPTPVRFAFPYFAQLPSAGTVSGTVDVTSPPTTALTGTSDVVVSSKQLPAGAVAPVGTVAYFVRNVDVGGTIDVQLELPPGSNPTSIYKVVDGAFIDVTSLASISGSLVTLHLTDGSLGDEDGLENGVVVDPVVPVKHVKGASTVFIGATDKVSTEGSSLGVTLFLTTKGRRGAINGKIEIFDKSRRLKTLTMSKASKTIRMAVSKSKSHVLYVKFLGSSKYRPTCSVPIVIHPAGTNR